MPADFNRRNPKLPRGEIGGVKTILLAPGHDTACPPGWSGMIE